MPRYIVQIAIYECNPAQTTLLKQDRGMQRTKIVDCFHVGLLLRAIFFIWCEAPISWLVCKFIFFSGSPPEKGDQGFLFFLNAI
jgi:hypothetical protein